MGSDMTQVRVRMFLRPIHPHDIYTLKGIFPAAHDLPVVLGADGARGIRHLELLVKDCGTSCSCQVLLNGHIAVSSLHASPCHLILERAVSMCDWETSLTFETSILPWFQMQAMASSTSTVRAQTSTRRGASV